jgi:hypothetical protein
MPKIDEIASVEWVGIDGWKPKIGSIVDNENKATFDCVVEFYKPGMAEQYAAFKFERVSDPDSLKKLIYQQLLQYIKIDRKAFEVGDIDLTEVIPEVVSPYVPTQDELNDEQFSKDLAKFKAMQKAVELGFLSDKDNIYTAQQVMVANAFIPARHLKYF